MTDSEMLLKLHSEMKELCLLSGIGKARYKRSLNNLNGQLEERLAFFKQVHIHWTEYKRIWDQHTPEQWAQLRILQGGSLREQKALKVAKCKLREFWGNAFMSNNFRKHNEIQTEVRNG